MRRRTKVDQGGPSAELVRRGPGGTGTVSIERDCSTPVRVRSDGAVATEEVGPSSPLPPEFIRGQERKRQAACRQRAIFFLLTHSARRPFPWLLGRIRRRWPVSAAGDEFEDRLRKLFEADSTRVVPATAPTAAEKPEPKTKGTPPGKGAL